MSSLGPLNGNISPLASSNSEDKLESDAGEGPVTEDCIWTAINLQHKKGIKPGKLLDES